MQSTTVRQVRQLCWQRLKIVYDEREAQNIGDWLVRDRLNMKNSTDLVMQADAEVPSHIALQIKHDLDELETGKPLQHILRKAHFCDLELIVSPQVLIPRPETEELVYLIYEGLKTNIPHVRILDIGTGSGCIPIALKSMLSQAKISAVDISREALEIARSNAVKYQMEINFKLLDILNLSHWSRVDKQDVIVSNPPYIPHGERANLHKNVVDFEPELALFSPDKDPFVFYKTIALFAQEQLTSNGKLFFELNPDFANEVLNFVEENGFKAIIKNDLQGKQRFLIANKV